MPRKPKIEPKVEEPKVEEPAAEESDPNAAEQKVDESTTDADGAGDDVAPDAAESTDDVEATGETSSDGDEPEPERAALAEAPTANLDAAFPTEWHRDTYISDLKREISGAERRLEELTALNAHPDAIAGAQTQIDNATAELARAKKA